MEAINIGLMLLIITIGGIVFFLPSIIAAKRNISGLGYFIVFNLIFGGTGIGWIILLIYACVANPL